jgi:8-oxo-dGTP pyrophosphatase MutT (NUDIX family)
MGGHVESGESPEEAVARECTEELGVLIQDPVAIPVRVDDVGLAMTTFLVTSWDGEPSNAAPEEHDELRWFLADDLASVRMAHPETRLDLARAVRSAAATGNEGTNEGRHGSGG